MSFDSIRGYVQLASGLGDATRARATEVAQGLLSLASRGGAAELAASVSALADDVMSQARGNREMLVRIIRQEVEDLMQSSSSLARSADLDSLREAVAQIATDLDGMRRQVGRDTPAKLLSGGAAAMATVAGQGRRRAPSVGVEAPGATAHATSADMAPRVAAARPKRVPPRRPGAALAQARGGGPDVVDARPGQAAPAVKKAAPAAKKAATVKKAAAPAVKKAAPVVRKAAPAVKKAAPRAGSGAS